MPVHYTSCSIPAHPAHQGFHENALSKSTYILSYRTLLQSALCPVRYLVQPRCTVFRLSSANSSFICLVNVFIFISLTRNADEIIIKQFFWIRDNFISHCLFVLLPARKLYPTKDTLKSKRVLGRQLWIPPPLQY